MKPWQLLVLSALTFGVGWCSALGVANWALGFSWAGPCFSLAMLDVFLALNFYRICRRESGPGVEAVTRDEEVTP